MARGQGAKAAGELSDSELEYPLVADSSCPQVEQSVMNQDHHVKSIGSKAEQHSHRALAFPQLSVLLSDYGGDPLGREPSAVHSFLGLKPLKTGARSSPRAP